MYLPPGNTLQDYGAVSVIPKMCTETPRMFQSPEVNAPACPCEQGLHGFSEFIFLNQYLVFPLDSKLTHRSRQDSDSHKMRIAVGSFKQVRLPRTL